MISKLLGRNLLSTPKEVVVDQMNEPRPLPMGRKEFEEWSERIISGALIPTKDGLVYHDIVNEAKKDPDSDFARHLTSQKFALCDLLLHLSPTESHKPDAFFIHSLRKFAINQVAIMLKDEMHKAAKARKEKEMELQKNDGELQAS